MKIQNDVTTISVIINRDITGMMCTWYVLVAVEVHGGAPSCPGETSSCLLVSCPAWWIPRAGGKGEVEAHGVDHWTLVGEKLMAEKRLAEDAKKVGHTLISLDNSVVFSRRWEEDYRRILVRTLSSIVIRGIYLVCS